MALLKKMNTVQNFAARWTVSAFRTTPSDACSLLAGFPPLVASLDKLIDSTHRRWHQLPPNHGLARTLAEPRLKFLHTDRRPSWLVNTPKGLIVVTPHPRVWKNPFTHPSPLVRATTQSWKSDFPVNWQDPIVRAPPPNTSIRERYWCRPLEDVGDFIQMESRDRDVYVLAVSVDQRL